MALSPMFKSQLSRWWSDNGTTVINGLVASFLVTVSAYFIGSAVATTTLGVLGEPAIKGKRLRSQQSPRVRVRKDINFRDVRKEVLGRNLFNSDGELPDESEIETDEVVEENPGLDGFDPAADCTKGKLDIKLLGTIFLGVRSPASLATVVEGGYNIPDVYRIGDSLYGKPQSVVYDIGPKLLVINNAGVKECVELEEPKISKRVSKVAGRPEPGFAGLEGVDGPVQPLGGPERVILESSDVLEALGPGFSKILSEGRLVPFHQDNQLSGYKLIGVKKGSLYTRIGLGNGDVLVAVNGVSMKRAEQGFALYTQLSEEKEIRIEFMKDGKTPSTVTVEVR